MYRKLMALVGVLVFAAFVLPAAQAITLKNNESIPPASVEGDALRKFKEIVEAKTNGAIEVDLHFHDELGNPQTSMENLGTGTLELYSGALSYYAALIPEELGVTTLLYLFKDSDHLRRYLTGPVFEKGKEKLIKDFGIRFLSDKFLGDRGPYRVWVSNKPALKIEDFVGVKMRLWPNDMAIRAWKHLGAVPNVMPWNEVYLALRQGRVDAVTSGVNGLHDSKLTEVAPYVTELHQFPQVWPITISEKIWQTLSADQQKILVDAANEATALYAQITYEMADSNMKEDIQKNNAVFSRINTDPFVEKMKPLYQQLIQEGVVKQEVYDEVMRLR
jgi:TRAP-type C4-dicarboxylate transport system substrate-binding protein